MRKNHQPIVNLGLPAVLLPTQKRNKHLDAVNRYQPRGAIRYNRKSDDDSERRVDHDFQQLAHRRWRSVNGASIQG